MDKTEDPLCHFIESTQTKPWGETTHLIKALNISGSLKWFLMDVDMVNKWKFVSCTCYTGFVVGQDCPIVNCYLNFLEFLQELHSFRFAAFLSDELIDVVNKTPGKWKTASMMPNFIGSSR